MSGIASLPGSADFDQQDQPAPPKPYQRSEGIVDSHLHRQCHGPAGISEGNRDRAPSAHAVHTNQGIAANLNEKRAPTRTENVQVRAVDI